MSEEPVKVLVVDDHQMMLDAISTNFAQERRLKLVGVCANSEDVIQATARTKPDVVLMDVCLPGRGAFELAADLIAPPLRTRVLLFSGFLADVFIAQALKMKLSGYVLKGEAMSFLIEAIVRAAAGETVYSQEIEQRIVFDPAQQRFVARYESDLSTLTGRQLEVLRHLACGQSVKEIAKVMHLSQKSVDSHKYRIMNKLGIHDRVELARFAIREGLMVP